MSVFMNGWFAFLCLSCVACLKVGSELSQLVQRSLYSPHVSFSTGMLLFLCSAKVLFSEALFKVCQRVVP